MDVDGVGDHLAPGNFLGEDPPLHTVLRGVVKDKFSVRTIRESLSKAIEEDVEELLATIEGKDTFDFGSECAWELPIRAGSHLMGYPREDCAYLRGFADAAFMKPPGPIGSESASEAARGAAGIRQYFAQQIDERRRRPKDDLLTQIALATLDGKPIGDAAAGVAGLIFGGSVDTTALTLTSAVNLLAQHHDQRTWFVNNPQATDQAVEEVFRYEGPIQVFRRTATTDVELHGKTIRRGASVLLLYGSANRDERQFEQPDQLDLQRKPNRHLAFGEGIHHCLGAPLARIEVVTMLRRFLELVPDYQVTGARRVKGIIRGFHSLQVTRV